MTRLYDTPFVRLLPGSIAEDSTIKAAAASLDGILVRTVQSVPNLLMYSRLLLTAGQAIPFTLLPALQRIINASGGLKALSMPELELLAWQFHVDFREVAHTNAQLAAMIVQSIPWHRIKGTPASLKRALALFGYGVSTAQDARSSDICSSAQEVPSRAAGVQRLPRQSPATASAAQDARSSDICIEEDGEGDYWATYQLGLPQIADIPTVQKILSIAREMQPARCRLWRIYTKVWDMRPAVYSGTWGYSDAYYTLYSGVLVPSSPSGGDTVLVSFGHKRGAQSRIDVKAVCAGWERLRATLCFRLDTLLYGYACYSDKPIRNHGFARYRLRQVHFEPSKTAWHFSRHSLSRIQAVYGESPYGDTNTRYGRPTVVTINNPPVYGESLYGLHDCQRHARVVDEINMRVRNTTTAPYIWPAPPSSGHNREGNHAAQVINVFPPNAVWRGVWDTRQWRAFGIPSKITRSYYEYRNLN